MKGKGSSCFFSEKQKRKNEGWNKENIKGKATIESIKRNGRKRKGRMEEESNIGIMLFSFTVVRSKEATTEHNIAIHINKLLVKQ